MKASKSCELGKGEGPFTAKVSVNGETTDITYEVIGDFAVVEGDIIVGIVDKSSRRLLGNVVLGRRWPSGEVPFEISPDFIDPNRVAQAVSVWNTLTNIRLVPYASQPNFVRFVNGADCASPVGMMGGMQPILLSALCSVGNIIHEIGHAVGLNHEHVRLDRDLFVRINWANIEPGREHNFQQSSFSQDVLFYDYGSIMHYPAWAFSVNNEPTITTLNGGVIGQRVALSAVDIATVNQIYPRSIPVPSKFCVTLIISHQGGFTPEAFVASISINGRQTIEMEIAYGSGGHKVYKAKVWCVRGMHRFTVNGRGVTTTKEVQINSETYAILFNFWDLVNGRRSDHWTVSHVDDYDDRYDDETCNANSVAVKSLLEYADATTISETEIERNSVDLESAKQSHQFRLLRDSEFLSQVPVPETELATFSDPVRRFDELVIDAGMRHEIPLGISMYVIKKLIMKKGSTIMIPPTTTYFTIHADVVDISELVSIIGEGQEGATGKDGVGIKKDGEDGGPGGPGCVLQLGFYSGWVGERFRVYLTGGRGGPGGRGSRGQTGFDAECFPPRKGRNGGGGGNGGFSGSGGGGGSLRITGRLQKDSLSRFQAYVFGGDSTNGGPGGPGGEGGKARACLLVIMDGGSRGSYGAFRTTDRNGRARAFENGIIINEVEFET